MATLSSPANPMRHAWLATLRSGIVALAALSVPGCVATGTGTGELVTAGPPLQRIEFVWSSSDGGTTGNLAAMWSGETLRGRFIQIREQTSAEMLVPLWVRWPHDWDDWPYWTPPDLGGIIPFVVRYRGKVVAALEGSTDRLRCRFHLRVPDRGMAGGGEGECQNRAGQVLHAHLAPG